MFGKLTRLSLAALLAGTMATSAFAASDAKVVKIGWAPWSDAEFVTKLAAKLIQDNLDQKVELVQTDVAPLYQGVSRGDLDAMMMAWLPATHADYYKRVEGKVEDLGPLYEGAKLGWVVPAYVPESDIKSIEDLKKAEIHEKLKGQIQGIDPGAGLTRLSEEAVKKYGLNYKLQISSEAAMLTTVDRSTRSEGWFVATAWSPHWMFGKYKLRYLEDPEGALGAAEHVNALARKGFKEDNPKVASLLEKMNIPLADLEKAMFEAQETSYDKAVDKYIADNPDRIKEWLAE
ncbi:glycine betaine ABC transporter substrate-binding protein [Pseudochrobactrum asaccharolyticum]|jgi:glycine betaine/proline transport system substrate-binding protein|uniref:Glycine betaine/proline transport system substrate-binding protein n=1 Tax=Pseudochrobactrum asaccharolyticum TaxID=354351 RepID=A0A366EC03_9HYPH|nr:glycine betaine ABC transporter substrate-binding protein [Pseudochrobactrum asaccharolyticum]MBX8802796.1 glycine betaine ABC transporter substrate-binding protein [Ochrobactrum sp. MR28]MBX8818344.1 glycine betaine ABC transporter substrate-binding protein [Ochrobactrum sp. MR31]MDR2312161.1 glycine betaine ABC transporter substrate-binding protein [Brucellaceae bacterium]RBO99269.1 glycine betaine/proline transport system substrate-binding protein [Pseudochrobactrum asaccharolyticum]